MNRSLALGALLLVPALSAAKTTFQSGARPAAFLTLFTSEGCSSCPPAESWLSSLKAEKRLWRDVVPAAFHVDYWDYLGWRDKLGSRRHSVLQRQMAATANATTYTPGFFLNGKEWRGWFNRTPLPPPAAAPVGVLRATETGPRRFVVEFSPAVPDKGPFEAHAALLGMDIRVHVSAGENSGSDLAHDFAVLGQRAASMEPKGGRFVATLTLEDEAAVAVSRHAAAFWVTRPGDHTAIQAAGGPLADSDGR